VYNRSDIVDAYYWYFLQYHGGQNSHEYKRLCKLLTYYSPSHSMQFGKLSFNAWGIYDGILKREGIVESQADIDSREHE